MISKPLRGDMPCFLAEGHFTLICVHLRASLLICNKNAVRDPRIIFTR